jgi:hypothetical protein
MSSETRLRRREWVGATTGAGVAAVFMFSTAIVLGTIASSEAFGLVEAILPTARFLAVGVLTAAITVLALLLTLLGMSLNGPYAFRSRFYFRIGRITTLSTAAIVAAVLLLLISGLPLEDIEDAQRFYDLYFYALSGGISVLGGLAISMALMIGSTLKGLAQIGEPGHSDLLDS